MVWGVTLESGKLYRQVVKDSYRVTNAALEASSTESTNKHVAVMMKHKDEEFVLCTLEDGRVLQVHLDLCFSKGEEIAFFLNGKGTVHLTGYMLGDSNEKEESDLDSGSEQESDTESKDLPSDWKSMKGVFQKQKDSSETNGKMSTKLKDKSPQGTKSPEDTNTSNKRAQLKQEALSKAVLPEEDSSDDEDDEDFIFKGGDEDEDEDESEDESEEDDSFDEMDEEDDIDEDEVEKLNLEKDLSPPKKLKLDNSKTSKSPFSPSKKTPKMDSFSAKTNQSQENGSAKKGKKQPQSTTGTPVQKNKTPGKNTTPESSKKSSSDDTPQSAGKMKKVFGGVDVQDTRPGTGPVAKPGKMVHVYYRGTLPNKNEFDSCLKGKPFSFRLGKNEVIKGWDVGIQGMKVGGKRTIVVPPNMGYGNKQTGPIPANSTLHFEVELKAVS